MARSIAPTMRRAIRNRRALRLASAATAAIDRHCTTPALLAAIALVVLWASGLFAGAWQ